MEDQNLYKGAPNHGLDGAWENLLHSKYCLSLNGVTSTLDLQLIRKTKGNGSVVDVEVIDRIGKSRDAVKYPKAQGGQYYVDIEVFHQMRCLVRNHPHSTHPHRRRPH